MAMAASTLRGGGPRLSAVPTPDERALRYAECRAMGHEWSHSGKPLDEAAVGHRVPLGVERTAVAFASSCRVCNTSRVKWIGRSGSLGVTVYRYPDGYSRHGDDERLSATEWRAAWIVRAMGD
jgi:hypothetical protein